MEIEKALKADREGIDCENLVSGEGNVIDKEGIVLGDREDIALSSREAIDKKKSIAFANRDITISKRPRLCIWDFFPTAQIYKFLSRFRSPGKRAEYNQKMIGLGDWDG